MFLSTRSWFSPGYSLVLLVTLLAFGCRSEIEVRPLPVAVVGTDRAAVVGDTPIVLDGLGSYVIGLPDTPPDTADWRIVVSPPGRGGEPAGTIEHRDDLRTNLYVNAPGLFVVRLDVSHEGRAGRPAYLNVHAREVFIPPVAVVGPNQTVDPGQVVTLDGSDSFAPEGGSLIYTWTQLEGTEVALDGADSPYATFNAPGPSGELSFALVVSDERRLSSEAATVVVTVRELPPVAVIDAPANVDETDVVLLGATRSYDPNEQAIVAFTWQAQWPGGDITIIDADEIAARFQAPRIVGPAPAIRVTLTVTNDVGDVASESVNIEINDVINDPPVANAGGPQTIGELATVHLDGSLSSDPNGDHLAYWWSQDAEGGGPTIHIFGADTPTPTFLAPRVGQNTDLTVALVVDDGRGETDRDTVVVTIEHRIVALGIHQEPLQSIVAGAPFSLVVEVLDDGGARETQADDQITLSLGAAPPGASLGGVLTRNATAGLAVFEGLSIQRAGADYQIIATSPLLSSVATIPFRVVPGPLHSAIDLQATPSSIVANGTSRTTITSGQITDQFGNLAADSTPVTVSTDRGHIDASDFSTEPGLQVTTFGGTITFDLVSGTVSGSAQVSAAALVGDAAGSLVIPFVPGPPTGVLDLVADETSLPADGIASASITGGPVTDANGNVVADGTLVTVSAQGGAIVTADADPSEPGVQVAVEDGQFVFEVVAGTTAGDLLVLAETIEGDAAGQVTIVLEPGPAAGTILLYASPDIIVADGTSQSVVTSDPIKDQFDNLVADGTPVSITVTGDASISTPDSTPADPASHTVGTAGGILTFTLVSGTTAGPVTVSAASGSATGDVSILQIAGPAARLAYESGDGQSGTVAQVLDDALVVLVTDAFGNPVEGTTVHWAPSMGGGAVSHAQVVSDVLGRSQVVATLGTASGTDVHQYTATAYGEGGDQLQDSPVVFSASGIAGPATALVLEGFPAIVAAGSFHTLTITALDEYGNLATGYTGTVGFTSPDVLAVLPAPTAFTAADQGVLVLTDAASLRSAGIQSIKTSDTTYPDVFGTHEGILVEPGEASPLTTTIAAAPTAIVADGASTSTITVRTKDAYGNARISGGDVVALQTTAGSMGPITDNGDGTYTATLTSSTTTGAAVVSGTLNADTIDDEATVGLLPGPASAATTTIAVSPASIEADGISTSAITVQARDSNSNNLTSGGDAVTLQTTAGSLGAVVDNGDGTYSAVLTSSTDASQTATITGTINTAAIADTATVDFVPGAASALTTTIIASPATITADGVSTSTVTVQAKDSSGNDITSGGDTVTLHTTAGGIGPVTDNGDGTYTATLTSSTTAVTAVVSGTLNGVAIANDATVDFLPGPASRLTTSITASPVSITADGASTSIVTVQARDAGGNDLSSGGDAVTLLTTAGSISAVVDNGDGTYTATLTSSIDAQETATITGTIGAEAIVDTATVDFVPGPASPLQTTISAAVAVLTADGTSTTTITVQAIDANGNALTAGGDTLTLQTTAGSIGAVVDNGDGTYTAIYTSATVMGSVTISGTLNGANILDTAAIDLVAGPAAAVSLIAAPAAPIAGEQTILTAMLTDANGNPVAGESVTFSVVSGQGTLESPSTSITGAAGSASLSYTTHVGVETATLRVQLDSDTTIFATVDVTSTQADPTQIVITFSPSATEAVGTSFMVVAEAQDDGGNPVTSYEGMVSIAILSGPVGATLLGETQVQAAGGLIAFLDLAVDLPGTYVLRVTDDAGLLAHADTPSFVVTLFEAGTGTAADPFQISNVLQLQAMNDHLDEHFVLISDIDASDTAGWNGGLGFQPIGDRDGPVPGYFTGTFDGQGNSITGLHIDRTGQRGYGLFGYLDGNAVVENVCLLDVDISGTEEVGAIAGRIENGNVVVRNVCSTGLVSGSIQRIGGLIGSIKDGTLENGWSRAEMIGGNEIGGAVGQNDGGTLRFTYSAGPVTGTGAAAGGLIGIQAGGVTQNSFWDVETSFLLTSAAGTGKSSEEMKDVRTYTDVAYSAGLTAPWDFVDDPFDDAAAADIWNLDSSRLINDGYPVLEIIDGLGTGAFALTTLTMLAPDGSGTVSPAAGTHTHTLNVTVTLEAFPGAGHKLDYWFGGVAEPDRLITSVTLDAAKTIQAYFTPLFAGGDGSLANPYRIADVHDLQAIQHNRSAHYVLVADIDASQTSLWNGGAGFVPVSADGTRFFGTFDGQGKVITGLTINRPGTTGVGLFGSAGANSIIENVCLEDVDIIGNREVGGIVGRVRENSAIVRFVCSTGRVEGIGEQVGGIAGRNEGSISNSYSQAWVLTSHRRAGGLVGENSRTIDSCYSTGLVEGPAEVGGLLGRGAGTTNSFWDTESSLMLTSAGGTGKTTAEMKAVATYTVAAPPALMTPWDFAAVWNIDGVIADGYPFLRVVWP